MSTYEYSAKNKLGAAVNGILDAKSVADAAELLHKKELTIISVREAKAKAEVRQAAGKKIKLDDMVIFSRQLSTMIEAGITLVYALGILSEQVENKDLRQIVVVVKRDIEGGCSFCDALSKHPKAFSELFINMVRAGEAAGKLEDVLDRLATYLEKSSALARKIRSSLVYPAVVVSMSVVITAVLLLKVVPTFKGIFSTLGENLPLPTQILIATSDLMQKYFLLLCGILIIAIFMLKRFIATKAGRYLVDKEKLSLPVLGPLFRKLAVAKFARTFSTLVKSGVPVLGALEIVSKTSGNKVVEEAVMDCSKSVRDGEAIARPLTKSGVFPPMVCGMISIGEQTGQLEKMLSKIADFYDEQVDAAASALTSMIEPLVIAFLGVVIGGIVIALFLPIFKLSELISR
ncbi:MAG: type II secretion system F family protein [Candidatus Omnitrophota bacterium]|nr:type II secretion system F family protein [Candidatus Omnitrophota bacterium]